MKGNVEKLLDAHSNMWERQIKELDALAKQMSDAYVGMTCRCSHLPKKYKGRRVVIRSVYRYTDHIRFGVDVGKSNSHRCWGGEYRIKFHQIDRTSFGATDDWKRG